MDIFLDIVLPTLGGAGVIFAIWRAIRTSRRENELDEREKKIAEEQKAKEEQMEKERKTRAEMWERLVAGIEKMANVFYAMMMEKMAEKESATGEEDIAAASAAVVTDASEAAFGVPFVYTGAMFKMPKKLWYIDKETPEGTSDIRVAP